MSNPYAIADEPAPSRLSPYVVNPGLPLIANMVGGSWIGLPWLVFNAYALNSAETRREVRLAALSPLLSLVVAFVATQVIRALGVPGPAALSRVLGMPPRAYAYAVVVAIAVKLWLVYAIHRSQAKSFEIFSYAGGKGRNALAVVVVAALVRPYVMEWALDLSIWLGWVVL